MPYSFDHLTGKVMHEAPPPEEAEPRIVGMFDWINRSWAAAIRHSSSREPLTMRSPTYTRSQTGMGGAAYSTALRSVKERTLDMEFWLDYFLRGLAEEYERVAVTVEDLSALLPGGDGAPLRLTTSQERAIAALRLIPRREDRLAVADGIPNGR